MEELVQILERNKGERITISYGGKESYLAITYVIRAYDIRADGSRIYLYDKREGEKLIMRYSDITDVHIEDDKIIYIETKNDRINLMLLCR